MLGEFFFNIIVFYGVFVLRCIYFREGVFLRFLGVIYSNSFFFLVLVSWL